METHLKYLNELHKIKTVNKNINIRESLRTEAVITSGDNNKVDVKLRFNKSNIKKLKERLVLLLQINFGEKYREISYVDARSKVLFDLDEVKYTFISKNNDEKMSMDDKRFIDLDINLKSISPFEIDEDDNYVSFEFKVKMDDVGHQIKSTLGSRYKTIKDGKIIHNEKEDIKPVSITFKKTGKEWYM